AKDPVNIAGYIADNRRHGQLSVQWHEVEALQEAGWLVVDVRTPGEFERGAIPGAVNIPVGELRERAGEVPAGARGMGQCRGDVRVRGEFGRGAIAGAVNSPGDERRERAGEIPAGAKVIAQCRVGLRGNVATQLLANRGATVANLDGGYVTWSYGQAAQKEKGK